ncbi:MAG: hypothetical protein IJY66_01025 [Clostridia bacterium]|nr:hypothetical protein [Clostridia bacterium]
MAYNNFIPTLWAEGIERDLERLCVFLEDCNRKYEGKVSQQGDSVRIYGVGKPTVYTMDRKNASGEIAAPEEIEDTSITLPIKQLCYFNFKVGDIDKAQAIPGVMETLRQESAEEMACVIDQYIASFAVDKSVQKVFEQPLKVVAGTAGEGEINVLHALDLVATKLRKNNVKRNTEVVVDVSPDFATLFRRAYIQLDTNNHDELKTNIIGRYNGLILKETNNTHKTDNGAVDNIMARTKRAIAFVNPLTHVEAYRPERMFADAVKGYQLFDGCVARPKEILNLNVTY